MLNFFRRILLILLGLLLVALITVVLLVPDTLVTIGQNLTQISPIIRTALVIVANVLILAVLYLQVRPLPHANPNGLIVRTSGALADVSLDSAQQRILAAVRSVPNVVSAEAKLAAIDGKADIDMDIGVVGDNVNVPKKQQEIDRALRQVTLKQLGLQLASRPRIHIRLLTEDDLAPPRPITPPPAPVEPPVIREMPRQPEPRDEEGSLFRDVPRAPAPASVIPAPIVVEEPTPLPPEPDFMDVTPPERAISPEPPTELTADESPSSDTGTSGLYDEDEERPTSEKEDWPPPPPSDGL